MPIIAGRASAAYGSGFGAVTTPPFSLTGSYDTLATFTLATSTLDVLFAGIPTGYKHLQIRWVGFSTDTTSSGLGNVRCSIFFNENVVQTNYRSHALAGNGTSPFSDYENSAKAGGNATRNSQIGAGVNIINILDYASTNKAKTVRTLTGFSNNDTSTSNQGVRLVSGLYPYTTAISTIRIVPESGSFKANSTFSLYGVR